uniref:F-box domain-containing protein n=1 Tax=Hordeum vulgare subsp. vulgare TaxID=112509 RepID=A0A8I6Y683_HORVV
MKFVRRHRRDLPKIDRLIKLPDDVLLNILERVGTLDAVRTCVLSKQTLKLPALLSQIVIVPSARDLRWKNRQVVDMTDKVLSTRFPHIPIRALKLRFIMRGDDHLRIGRFVALAMAKQKQKVDAAEFEILTKRQHNEYSHDDLLSFAKLFNDFINECPAAFAGLTRLHLHNLRFGPSDVSTILGTCTRLDSLCFFQCDAGERSVLTVHHARLAELDITSGKFLEIRLGRLPNLQRMSYKNWHYDDHYPLALGFVPRLSNLDLSRGYTIDRALDLSKLLAKVPPISDLHLDFQSEKIWIRPECPKVLAPLLGQLRLVNLDNLPEEFDIAWTMFLLEAAPSIEELSITVWGHKCQRKSQISYPNIMDVKWEPSTPDFKHKNLGRLNIYGFQSNDDFMGYVRRVVQAAVNIKEVTLHHRKVCKVCVDKFLGLGVRPWSCLGTREEVESFKTKITEMINARARAMSMASAHKIRRDVCIDKLPHRLGVRPTSEENDSFRKKIT